MNRSVICLTLFALFILVVPIFSPLVDAREQSESKSGRVITKAEVITISPDDALNWTTRLNLANGSDYGKLDYNLTWQPFFENNTDLKGIVVHNLLPPILFEPNVTNQSMSLACVFRLAPEQIMDGISEVWFRLPVTEIPYDSAIRARVYRVLSTSGFNISYLSLGVFTSPNAEQTLQKVYDLTIDPKDSSTLIGWNRPNCWANYTRHLNVSVPDTNGSFYYNWTFLKACFGMFPNEWYAVMFDISSPMAQNMKVCWTTGDFGSDGRYNSWIWVNGTAYYAPIDLDMSFVATCGVSNGITGIGTNENHLPDPVRPNMFAINASIPIDQTTVNTSRRYFNILVPFYVNATESIGNDNHLFVCIDLYNSTAETASTAWYREFMTTYHVNSTYGFYLKTIDLDHYNNSYIDHIRISFQLIGYQPDYPNATRIKFWGTQNAVNATVGGFTDIYWYGYAFAGGTPCYLSERQWFIPFGYYGLDSWYWNMTNYSMWTVPIAQPESPQNISEAIQDFEVWLEGRNDADVVELIEHWIGRLIFGLIDFTYHTIGKAFANGFKWAYDHTPLKVLVDWIASLPGWNEVWKFFKGIAEWLWDVINMVYDALEWFGYWAVRIIYSFSLAIVYIINVFGVISISSALFNYAKTGNGRDFLRAFRAGWAFIYRIIALLISLAIMAIGIVAAVIPL